MAGGFAVGGGGSSHSPAHGAHGLFGLLTNLGSDVKDAAFGLPKGLLMTAEHPIRSAEGIGKATWQTWSPLFHGHPGTFLHQTYDHPLAPLLDVMSVFTGGAGLAAKLGAKAGELGLVDEGSALARLGKAGKHMISDQGGRPALPKYTSTNPVTRLGQGQVLKLMHQADQHLPTWFTHHVFGTQATYNRLHFVDIAHRHAAMNMQIAAMMKAGQALTDPATRAKIEPVLMAHNSLNLVRHAREIAPHEALPEGYRYVLDARFLPGNGTARLGRLRKTEVRLEARRQAHAELAHMGDSLAREQNAIQGHLEELAAIRRKAADLAKANMTAAERSREAGRINAQLDKLTKQAALHKDRLENGLVLHAEGKLAADKLLQRVAKSKGIDKALAETKAAARENRRAGTAAAREQELQAARFSGVEMAKLQHADATLAELRKTARSIKRLKQRAAISKEIHGRTVERLGAVKGERMNLEQRSFRDYFNRGSEVSFENRVMNFGRDFTTQDLAKAATTAKGAVKIVPLHDAKALGLEAANSASFLKKLYRAPTKLWKTILLGYSPRVVINNGVGNWFMYAMRQGGGHSFRGLVDAVRFSHGEKAATKMLGETARITNPHFLRRYFGDELGNTFGFNTLASDTGKTPSKLSQGLYPAVHKLADQPVRAAAISAFLRSDPAVRGLMKQGIPFEKAAGRVLSKDPELRDQAALHARKIAGDYFTMGPTERVVRDFIPFYLWDKHIVKHVGNLAAERPARLALAAAVGKAGSQALTNQLGDIPDFMLNSIPLPASQKGRQLMLSTVGMNPYSTIPDLFDFAQSVTTGGTPKVGEAVGSQLNPLIENLIQQVSGHTLTTDGSVQRHGGIVPSVLAATAEGLPAVQLAENVGGKRVKTKKPPLYAHDLDEILSSLAGVPIKKANLARANQLGRQDKGIKKPKHHRGFAVA